MYFCNYKNRVYGYLSLFDTLTIAVLFLQPSVITDLLHSAVHAHLSRISSRNLKVDSAAILKYFCKLFYN